ncbi:MAG: ComF family protein [Gammaproteobacteria bacterium]|nr:MAG: ComF family protein [Gammaproteobacteria bacterium]
MTTRIPLITSAFKKAGALLYPKVCLHCNDAGHNGMDLCERCLQRLPWVEYACSRCALPLQSGKASVCGACSNRELYFDHASTPFQFDGFIRDAIYQFKFNNKLNQGKLLAELLLQHIEEKQLEVPELIIPVPLHKKRMRQRGYNQALEIARIISKELAKEWGSQLDYDIVYRNRDTSVQMDLPAKQRHKNVKGAFSVNENSTVLKNKQVCIIDDVMTTGNTVNEMAKCLKEAGVDRVGVWCIARVA